MSSIMKRDNLILPVLFLLVLAAVAGLAALRGGGDAAGQSMSMVAPATRPAATGEFRGVSLQLHSSDPDHPYETLVDEIANSGANTVNLVVPGWQENASSTSIFIDVRKGPTPKRLVEIIRHARKKGLHVVLMPIVLLENGREGEWRGKIGPEKWDGDAAATHWWEEYNSYILHTARLAQEGGADVFMVGSELVGVESQTDRWKALIAEVRKVYTGRLSYSANWDHYKPVDFWGVLDIVGMTTYYDLCGDKKPTMDVLLATWKGIRKEVLEWQAKIGRPLLFTEAGWPNQITAAQFPWDYYRSPDKPDPKLQADCFESFFRTWADEPAVAGWLVWEWRTSLDQKPDEKDTSYNPEGKPAMAIIKKYFGHAKAAADANMLVTTRAVETAPAGMPAEQAAQNEPEPTGKPAPQTE
jgi:hypothetical protein